MISRSEQPRDIGFEILEGLREFKAYERGEIELKTHTVTVPDPVTAREKTGLSQPAFAALMGVSVRTLQAWEQGRRKPSGPASQLLRVATHHPEIFTTSGC
jgi:putative transcriptional regulator